MYMTTIGIKSSDCQIKSYIISELESIKTIDFDVIHENYMVGDIFFINCGLKEGLFAKIKESKAYDELIYNLSVILSDVIINNYEAKLIKKIIKDFCLYLTDYEKVQIYELAGRIIKKEDSVDDGVFYKQSRKTRIVKKIMNYLKTENIIIIDGFVKFRLNEYMKELYDIVEKAVEEYVTEKEYNEFIKLLRYFVEIQESKIDTIHVMPAKDGRYILLDNEKSMVNCECYDDIQPEIIGNEINYDDILISNLITIAPKKIYIHNIQGFANKELIKTICNVFFDRTEICKNCEICGFESIKNKEFN